MPKFQKNTIFLWIQGHRNGQTAHCAVECSVAKKDERVPAWREPEIRSTLKDGLMLELKRVQSLLSAQQGALAPGVLDPFTAHQHQHQHHCSSASSSSYQHPRHQISISHNTNWVVLNVLLPHHRCQGNEVYKLAQRETGELIRDCQ